MMGASNPHPHCQIWSNQSLPVELAKEQAAQDDYRHGHGSCLLCDYARQEEKAGERIICANSSFVALVPFWAVWPFEAMLLARRHVTGIDQLTDAERDDLADIMKRLTSRYDALFDVSFPYTMGFHQRPTDGAEHAEWHFHAHYYPPLLRSATGAQVHGGVTRCWGTRSGTSPRNPRRSVCETSSHDSGGARHRSWRLLHALPGGGAGRGGTAGSTAAGRCGAKVGAKVCRRIMELSPSASGRHCRWPRGTSRCRWDGRCWVTGSLAEPDASQVSEVARLLDLRSPEFLFEPEAASRVVLSPAELESGAIILDPRRAVVIGGRVVRWRGGGMSAAFPWGGDHFTQDIAASLQVPLERRRGTQGTPRLGVRP